MLPRGSVLISGPYPLELVRNRVIRGQCPPARRVIPLLSKNFLGRPLASAPFGSKIGSLKWAFPWKSAQRGTRPHQLATCRPATWLLLEAPAHTMVDRSQCSKWLKTCFSSFCCLVEASSTSRKVRPPMLTGVLKQKSRRKCEVVVPSHQDHFVMQYVSIERKRNVRTPGAPGTRAVLTIVVNGGLQEGALRI